MKWGVAQYSVKQLIELVTGIRGYNLAVGVGQLRKVFFYRC